MKPRQVAGLVLVVTIVTLGALYYYGADDLLEEESAPPPPARSEAPPAPPAAPVASAAWSAANIRELVPVAPTRTGSVSRPVPALPDYDQALATLSTVLERHAGDPENPWAVMHGVLARGPEFRLADGRQGLAHVFAAYAEPRNFGSLTLLSFPKTRAGKPVEPHSDLVLKNLSEVGVLPEASFPVGAGVATAADLYRATLLKTWIRMAENKLSFDGFNDMPWGLQALAAWAPSDDLRWVADDGTSMDMHTFTDFTVAVLHTESKFMFQAMANGQDFERKGQPLFGYACGGAHMVQGASFAVARGFGRPESRKAVTAQGALLFYRLPVELRIYDDAMKKMRQHRQKLLVQRLKFLGHWLETISKLEILGFFTPDDVQAATIEGAAQNLVITVKAIEDEGLFGDMASVRARDEQLYLDLVGDSAHAIRGLELALGRQSLTW